MTEITKLIESQIHNPLHELNLPLSIANPLDRAGVQTIKQVVALGEDGLSSINNLGSTRIDFILDAVSNYFGVSRNQLRKMSNNLQSIDDRKQYSESYRAKLPERVINLPINVLDFDSARARNALAGAQIRTIGDFLDMNLSTLKKIKGVGELTLKNISVVKEDLMARIKQGENLEKIVKNEPFLFSSDSNEIPNLVELIVPFSKQLLSTFYKDERGFQMIDYYYGLGRNETYTLQDIGGAEGISRERVRQINTRSIKRINAAMLGKKESSRVRVPDEIINEAREIKSIIAGQSVVVPEEDIKALLEERYNSAIESSKINIFRFLLVAMGFEQIPKRIPGYNGTSIFAWKTDPTKKIKEMWNALIAIYNALQQSVTPFSFFELKIQINKRRKKAIDSSFVLLALRICPDIEKISENSYQLKFPYLSSIADQAYRILFVNGEPMHYRDIHREINHFLASSGFPANAQSRTLTGQLASDSRFQPIGRSGKWVLTQWDHVHTQTTISIMEEFFHLKKSPATIDEIHSYVVTKRPDVPKHSVIAYLYDKDIFIRVSPSKFALAIWGHKPAPKQRNASMEERLVPELKEIFKDETGVIIPLRELVLELVERTGLVENNIYAWLKRSTLVKIEDSPTHSRRKNAKYIGDKTIAGSKSPKKTLMQIVQEEVENYLRKQPDKKASISEIYEYVSEKTKCKKPTFYNYLSRIDHVQKEKIGNQTFCYLEEDEDIEVDEPRLAFPQLMQITEEPLRSNTLRAVQLLNIENVDIGLFQLGKIFENELKAFLEEARRKNAFTVTKNDLKRLVDMINCVEREKIVSKKHHLTFLRQERNERAHGEIPQYEEREELMRYAPFFGGLYLDYIILFYKERLKLKK